MANNNKGTKNGDSEVNFNTLKKKHVKSRAAFKSKITICLKLLHELKDKGELTKDIFQRRETKINGWCTKIEETNVDLDELCDEHEISLDDPERNEDTENEISYIAKLQIDISQLFGSISESCPEQPFNESVTSQQGNDALLAAALQKLQTVEVKPPTLQCATFSGGGSDRLELKNFFVQFQTA